MSYISRDNDNCNTKFELNKEILLNSQGNDQLHHQKVYQNFRSVLRKTNAFENVKQVLVGVSGGVDSAVLLHLLCEHQKNENGPKVFALHVQHHQRGEESLRDQECAKEIAQRYGVPFDAVALYVQKGASEEELRTLRKEAMENYAREHSLERIVLAHHMDDQAETFLFRLIRGSDIKGLSSMKAFRSPYVRPLLECLRSDIEREAEIFKIPYVTDSSNLLTGPSRNYIRNVVMPALKSKIDPQVVTHLADMASSMLEIDLYITTQANEMIEKVRVQENVYSVKALQSVSPALRKKMIQGMYTYIIKDKGSLSRDQVEMIDQWMDSPQSPKFLMLPLRIRVEKKLGVLTFSKVDVTPDGV